MMFPHDERSLLRSIAGQLDPAEFLPGEVSSFKLSSLAGWRFGQICIFSPFDDRLASTDEFVLEIDDELAEFQDACMVELSLAGVSIERELWPAWAHRQIHQSLFGDMTDEACSALLETLSEIVRVRLMLRAKWFSSVGDFGHGIVLPVSA